MPAEKYLITLPKAVSFVKYFPLRHLNLAHMYSIALLLMSQQIIFQECLIMSAKQFLNIP